MQANIHLTVFTAVLVTAVLAAPASFGDTYDVKRLDGDTLKAEEVIESLEQPAGQLMTRGRSGPKVRGLTVVDEVAPVKLKAIAVPIRFEFGSSELAGNAKRTLDIVGQALESPTLSDQTILVEGHTDAVGSEAYNLRLSESRAMAVKNYLVEKTGVDASRLVTVGRGEEAPLDSTDPASGVNRRVQFVNVTGQ